MMLKLYIIMSSIVHENDRNLGEGVDILPAVQPFHFIFTWIKYLKLN